MKPAVPVLTVTLIGISILIALLTQLGSHSPILNALYIADPATGGFVAINSGQVWRLITPIFLHFSLMHIVFNMLWIWDLGRMVEWRRGALFLAAFVLIVGIASNLVEYAMTKWPQFGGMSAVIYGLLGFVWMQSKYNPRPGFVLAQPTVVMMLVWFVVCWLGLVDAVGNWAHTAGLLIGIAWGLISRGGSRTPV